VHGLLATPTNMLMPTAATTLHQAQ